MIQHKRCDDERQYMDHETSSKIRCGGRLAKYRFVVTLGAAGTTQASGKSCHLVVVEGLAIIMPPGGSLSNSAYLWQVA